MAGEAGPVRAGRPSTVEPRSLRESACDGYSAGHESTDEL